MKKSDLLANSISKIKGIAPEKAKSGMAYFTVIDQIKEIDWDEEVLPVDEKEEAEKIYEVTAALLKKLGPHIGKM